MGTDNDSKSFLGTNSPEMRNGHWKTSKVGLAFYYFSTSEHVYDTNLPRDDPTSNQRSSINRKSVTTTAIPYTNEHSYYIPLSPMLTYTSFPNVFGETLEWFGIVMVSQVSLGTLGSILCVRGIRLDAEGSFT